MAPDPFLLSKGALDFLRERHLATLSLTRADGSIQVTPVGFTWDADTGSAKIITFRDAHKVALALRQGARGTLCQVDGGRWLSLEGPVNVSSDPKRCVDAEERYGERYQAPRRLGENRRTIEITVDRVTSSSGLRLP